MTDTETTNGNNPEQKKCPVCDGSGQIGQFRGESRFMICWEDCPDCHGTGVELQTPQNSNKEE